GLVVAKPIREDAVGDLGRAPAGELGEQRLFFGRRRAVLGLQALDQFNDLDVALGRVLPRTLAGQFSRLDAVVARRAYRARLMLNRRSSLVCSYRLIGSSGSASSSVCSRG